jgi:hypothetical protein
MLIGGGIVNVRSRLRAGPGSSAAAPGVSEESDHVDHDAGG